MLFKVVEEHIRIVPDELFLVGILGVGDDQVVGSNLMLRQFVAQVVAIVFRQIHGLVERVEAVELNHEVIFGFPHIGDDHHAIVVGISHGHMSAATCNEGHLGTVGLVFRSVGGQAHGNIGMHLVADRVGESGCGQIVAGIDSLHGIGVAALCQLAPFSIGIVAGLLLLAEQGPCGLVAHVGSLHAVEVIADTALRSLVHGRL